MGFYSGAEQILGDIKTQKKSYADTVRTAENLPSSLKEGFRKKGDAGLDDAIVKAEQRTLGGAIEGLDKFQDIQNPFTRRNLAEKYQSSLSRTQQSLYGERDRRQGSITDYINAWTGTYGAKAKAEQVALQGMESEFSMEMQLAGKKEAAYNRSQTASKTMSDSEARIAINEGFNEGLNWEEISKELGDLGVKMKRGEAADSELRRVFGHKTVETEDAESELKTIIDKENRGVYQDHVEDIRMGKGGDNVEIDEDGSIIKWHYGKWGSGDNRKEIIMRNPNI